MKTAIRRLAVLAAGGLLTAGLAVPALAAGNPSPCNGSTTDPGCSDSVAGSVIVPASLTMSLQGSSFSIPVNAGSVANTPLPSAGAVSIANVFTTNQKGFTFTEALSPAAGFGSGSATLSGNVIQPWAYSNGSGGFGGSGGWAPSFGVAGAAQTIWATTGPNADTAGTTIPMAWQVSPPAVQAAGTYTGSVNLLALANL